MGMDSEETYDIFSELRETFKDFSSEIEDSRVERNKLHSIEEILLLTLTAIICGCEGWRDIERFGKAKVDFLRTIFPFTYGTPSDDTLRLFYRALDPESFKTLFSAWAMTLNLKGSKQHIAIDGKVSRRSYDGEGHPLHMVSAFVSEHKIVLAQQKVADKSNEITAIPILLNVLELKGSVVTIDAMGCQRDISHQIITKEADYILALKGNQSLLHKDAKLLFESTPVLEKKRESQSETIDGSEHGRVEIRKFRSITCPEILEKQHNWPGLKSFVEIESTRECDGKAHTERRYYITSLPAQALIIAPKIRAHWEIENSLHYILDVSFREDDSRIRKGNAPENIAIMRHMALNLLQKSKGKRDSIKQLRKASGWDNALLLRVLGNL